jgi:hypothetical protein
MAVSSPGTGPVVTGTADPDLIVGGSASAIADPTETDTIALLGVPDLAVNEDVLLA